MVDRWKAENWASYSLFLTEPEADAFIAAQAVPWDWTKSFVSVEETVEPTWANSFYEEGRKMNVVTDVPNDWAFETNIAEYTVPGEMLWNDGDSVFLESFWKFWTTANGKRLKAYVWLETVFDSWSQAQNDWDWHLIIKVFKSWLTQKVIVSAKYSDEVTLFADVIEYTNTTQDTTVDMLVRVTGEGIDPDDVTCKASTASYQKGI